MNGEIPSVPITTLAGVASLTDLLPQLPLPTPLPHSLGNRSLLYHATIRDEAKNLIHTKDPNLISQLVSALRKTNTDDIELKDSTGVDTSEIDGPPLLKGILSYDQNVFRGGPKYSNADTGAPTEPAHFSPARASSPPSISTDVSNKSQTPKPAYDVNKQQNANKAAAANPYQAAFLNFATRQQDNPPETSNDFSPAKPTPSQSEVGHLSTSISEPSRPSGSAEPAQTPEIKKKKHRDSSFKVINSAMEASKLTLKISKSASKADSKRDRHSSKRRRSEDDDISITEVSNVSSTSAEFNASLTERVKRRRRQVNYRDGVVADGEESPEVISDDEEVVVLDKPSRKDKKDRKRRRDEGDGEYRPPGEDPVAKLLDAPTRSYRDEQAKSSSTKTNSSTTATTTKITKPSRGGESRMKVKLMTGPMVVLEDCMEQSPTLKKFLMLVDTCMEAAEDIDISELNADDDTGDSIVHVGVLSDLCYEAAKLKSTGKMNEIPYEKLVRLLTILQFNIRDGCKAIPAPGDDDEDDEHLLREITLEKTLGAIDAGLIALYIMTAKDMPKEVYLEDVIDRLVRMTKTQLQNTIFPEFDPVYRTDPKNKTGYQGNLKAKRARSGGTKNRTVLQIYNKITELIAYMAELVEIQELTDTIILQTSTLAVSPFFVENINELQLNALKLVTSIFSKYDKHRQLILEDILASLARLPSSKKNLRSYRLNSDEQIQMVSALVLQLIQCVVVLSQEEMLPPGEVNESTRPVDQEVVIQTSYEHAMRTAHNFLSVFLKKCTTKGEDDYRPLFENFVYDLLATVNKPEWPAAELLLSLLGRLLVQQFSNKAVEMSLRVASLDYLGIVASRLRKDEVSSRLNEKVIDQIIKHIQGKDDEQDEDNRSNDDEEEAREKEDTSKEGEKDTDEVTKDADDDADDGDEEKTEKSKKSKKKKRKTSRRSSRRSSVDSKNKSEDEEEEEEDEDEQPKKSKSKASAKKRKTIDDSRTQHLQQSLLEYLVYNAQNDPALIFAREFYIGQWYRDCSLEVERATRRTKKKKVPTATLR